MFQERRR